MDGNSVQMNYPDWLDATLIFVEPEYHYDYQERYAIMKEAGEHESTIKAEINRMFLAGKYHDRH